MMLTETTRQIRDALLVLIAALVLVVAATVGYSVAADPPPDSGSPEAGFARDMIVHHAQAVLMSDIVRDRTADATIRYLAYDTANGQQAQIGMLSGWLQQWGLSQSDDSRPRMAWMSASTGHGAAKTPAQMGHVHELLPDGRMPGMATTADVERLRTLSGREAEIFWLRLMIDHHRGGIAMAEMAKELVTAPYERHLAEGIVSSQQADVEYMQQLLASRGASPS